MEVAFGSGTASGRRRPITVLVVDRDESVRGHLPALLERAPDISVVGSVPDPSSALSLVAAFAVKVAVVDAYVVGSSGRQLCHEIRLKSPSTRCILHVTTELEPDERDAPGVDAVVSKRLVGSELVATIRALAVTG